MHKGQPIIGSENLDVPDNPLLSLFKSLATRLIMQCSPVCEVVGDLSIPRAQGFGANQGILHNCRHPIYKCLFQSSAHGLDFDNTLVSLYAARQRSMQTSVKQLAGLPFLRKIIYLHHISMAMCITMNSSTWLQAVQQ